MTDLPNVITVGVQSANEALHELKHSLNRRSKREGGRKAPDEDAEPGQEFAGEGAEQEEHQLDVKV